MEDEEDDQLRKEEFSEDEFNEDDSEVCEPDSMGQTLQCFRP